MKGILDYQGLNNNPLTNLPYSDEYKRLAKVWSTYPAYQKKEEVLESIDQNQITFIISGTGSGKTVLIPKYALHYTDYQGKVAISLPKRVITLSAAMFAAKTLDVNLGDSVGYAYKGSDKSVLNEKNKIVYMTDGSLIMKIVNDPLLLEYKVIIIDEAHERKVQIDLLMLFLKKILLSGKRPDLKLIIMSATIDGDKYQKYFSGIKSNIVRISGLPNYPINTIFLKEETNNYLKSGLEIIEKLISDKERQSVLFFISTSNEAFQLCQTVKENKNDIYCIELYADMDKNLKIYAESRDEYKTLGPYKQKLVMATNVAESSITIDGLENVIDSCYELYSYYHPEYMANVLEKRLITKAQALQRRGRVGRTGPGSCYHLVTKEQFDKLEDYPAPDILKQDITIDILKVIQLTEHKTYSEGEKLLNELMDKPSNTYINVSNNLFKLYNVIDDKGTLTKIGYEITAFSSLPINRSLFLIYSYQMYCAKEASIILAMMDILNGKFGNLFFKLDEKISRDIIKKLFDKKSDHLSYLKIYEEYKKASNRISWARKYGIKLDLLNKVDKQVNQFYFKIINLSKAPQFDRVKEIDVKKKILEALKLSHKHLVANKLKSTYPNKIISGSISKDSTLNYFYKRDHFSKKTFIYDDLISLNGNFEFTNISIL